MYECTHIYTCAYARTYAHAETHRHTYICTHQSPKQNDTNDTRIYWTLLHTENTYIYTHKHSNNKKLPKTETNLYRLEVKREKDKKAIKETIKNLHGQLPPVGKSHTQNIESNKIKTTHQNNLYYKEKKHTPENLKCLKRTRKSEIRVVQIHGIINEYIYKYRI